MAGDGRLALLDPINRHKAAFPADGWNRFMVHSGQWLIFPTHFTGCGHHCLALLIVAPFAVDRTSDHELRIAVVFHEHPTKIFPYHSDRHQLYA